MKGRKAAKYKLNVGDGAKRAADGGGQLGGGVKEMTAGRSHAALGHEFAITVLHTSSRTGWIGELSKTRKVIAVEMQGHGCTADITRDITYENLADDVAALLDHLKIPRADLIGYSMGGTVAMQCAIRHPDKVRKVVVISSWFRREGVVKEGLDALAKLTVDAFNGSPIEAEYKKLSPTPDDFPKFVKRLLATSSKGHDIGADQLKASTAPMFFIHGDADGGATRARRGNVSPERRRDPRRHQAPLRIAIGHLARQHTRYAGEPHVHYRPASERLSRGEAPKAIDICDSTAHHYNQRHEGEIREQTNNHQPPGRRPPEANCLLQGARFFTQSAILRRHWRRHWRAHRRQRHNSCYVAYARAVRR